MNKDLILSKFKNLEKIKTDKTLRKKIIKRSCIGVLIIGCLFKVGVLKNRNTEIYKIYQEIDQHEYIAINEEYKVCKNTSGDSIYFYDDIVEGHRRKIASLVNELDKIKKKPLIFINIGE